ncbi:MFS transporter [Nonomuraea recticatena]|uniref:MFS transporter n=1 Tax=Nonomuraea recticatena TaxID=46178 RepID=UPI00361A4252
MYLVLAVVGLSSAMVLYEAAFAVVVAWHPVESRARALLAVTIVAGFASSIFLPLTGLLVDRYGWRTALVVLGVGYGLLAVPLHWLTLRNRTATRPSSGYVCAPPAWRARAAWSATSARSERPRCGPPYARRSSWPTRLW